MYVSCTQEARDALSRQDPALGAVIARMGKIQRLRSGPPFESLVGSIVSQLISRKAASTIYGRVVDACGGKVTPEQLLAVGVEGLRTCGLSMKKAESAFTLAQKTVAGELPFEKFPQMSDQEVIDLLSALPGIGVWTAQMLLIFGQDRPDVFTYLDLGVRGGLCKLQGLEKISKKEFAEYGKRYSPYGTVASLYMWAIWGEAQGQKGDAKPLAKEIP